MNFEDPSGEWALAGIYVPTAQENDTQGQNGSEDRFHLPRDSFTFRGRNEGWQLSNRAQQLSARAKRGKTAKRGQTAILNGDQGKGNCLKAKERVRSYGFCPRDIIFIAVGYIFPLQRDLLNHKSSNLISIYLWMPPTLPPISFQEFP